MLVCLDRAMDKVPGPWETVLTSAAASFVSLANLHWIFVFFTDFLSPKLYLVLSLVPWRGGRVELQPR